MLLQPPSSAHKIDLKCSQRHKPTKKDNSKKNKSNDTSLADVIYNKHPQQSSIYQNQTSKKDQDHPKRFLTL